jgi:hypothetical protein
MGLGIGYWSRWAFMTCVVFTLINLASMKPAYASEEITHGSRVDPVKDQSIKAKFMAQLSGIEDFSKQKQRWMEVYAGLEDQIHNVNNNLKSMEVELANAEKKNLRKHLTRISTALRQMISSYRFLQDLAVQEYSLVSKLESLEQSLTQNVLSKADYLNEQARIAQQIVQIEQLRLWENLASDVAFFLKEIADEVSDLEFPISTIRLK